VSEVNGETWGTGNYMTEGVSKLDDAKDIVGVTTPVGLSASLDAYF